MSKNKYKSKTRDHCTQTIEFSRQARISQCESALTLTINFPHQQLCLPTFKIHKLTHPWKIPIHCKLPPTYWKHKHTTMLSCCKQKAQDQTGLYFIHGTNRCRYSMRNPQSFRIDHHYSGSLFTPAQQDISTSILYCAVWIHNTARDCMHLIIVTIEM